MARYGLIIDVDKCSGCYNCFVACKDEHCGNDHLPVAASQPEMGHYWMNIVEKERGQYPKVKVASIPVTCMQCAEAPCLAAAAAAGAPGAVYRRDDGIVIIDPVKAKGHKALVEACPYGVIFWNEAAGLPQKCTLCAHLLDAGWKEPRCVEACPTGALIFGDLDDSATEIAEATAAGGLEELQPRARDQADHEIPWASAKVRGRNRVSRGCRRVRGGRRRRVPARRSDVGHDDQCFRRLRVRRAGG